MLRKISKYIAYSEVERYAKNMNCPLDHGIYSPPLSEARMQCQRVK